MSKMRTANYARVSREEQLHGYSVDAQLNACAAYAQAQGWEVVSEFVEPGISGTTDQRPEFQYMVKAALAGEFEVVLVHKFDRLARNRFDAVLYKNMLRQAGIAVVSATEPSAEDGPAGMLVEGMLEVVAEWYSINLSAEVKKGIRRKAANGEPIGPVPLGYHREAGSSLVAITEIGAQISDAFDEFATGGYSLRSWAQEAFQRGYRSRAGNRIPVSMWQVMFRNRFYLGAIVYDGNQYTGRHTPLVDEDTFMSVQAILDSRPSGGQQRRKRQYLLSGLLWSVDYETTMVGTTAKQHYRYYRAKVAGFPELLIPEGIAEEGILSQLYHVIVNGADLTVFPADLRLALSVAPNLGLIYQALDGAEAKRLLLSGAVRRVIVEERQVVGLDLRDGFEFDSDRSNPPDSNPLTQILSLLLYTEVPHETP